MRWRRVQIPFVRQMTGTECGAACLAMVLKHYGKDVPLEEVRDVTGVNRDGATARGLLQAGRWYGLRGRGVKVELDELDCLDPGTILHWQLNHFVVFERLRRGGIDIVDPQFGRRHVPRQELGRCFTGVALLFEPDEDFTSARQVDRPVWRYLRTALGSSRSWGRLLALSLLVQLLTAALPLVTGAVVDRVVPDHDGQTLRVLGLGVAVVVAFHFLSTMSRAHVLVQLRTELDIRLTSGFVGHLLELPFSFFQQRATGDILMRLHSSGVIRDIVTSGALSTVLDGLMVLIYVALLLVRSPLFGLLVLLLGALQLTLMLLVRRRQRDLQAQSLHAEAKVQGHEVELLAGIETIKATATEPSFVAEWSDLFFDAMNVTLHKARLQALVDSLASGLRLAAPMVLLLVGTDRVLAGRMSLGTMLALNALAVGFLVPLANLLATSTQLQTLGGYIERLDDVLRAPVEQPRGSARPTPRLRGAIRLDRVRFRYSPLAADVIKDVSVDIAPGQFVAVVGASGSGKSTLASLLMGLHRPTDGRIEYDGCDVSELELRSLRRQMGIVTQRPYLFGTNIRANIALADRTRPLPDVVAAAQAAEVHEDIAAIPMGYETLLFDGGSSLSGGQRQRIALARALLHHPAILLLDEATSALDSLVEKKIEQALANLSCTRIVIAHRLSTIAAADLILVMHEGELVERGTHAQLMAAAGRYAQLARAQGLGELPRRTLA